MNIRKAIESLERKGFAVRYFEAGAEAADYVCSECRGRTVGMGGSMTIKQRGLPERLREECTLYAHQYDGDASLPLAAGAELYLTSANGISETGEIINIDGRGNRVASTLYGHERVIIVCGVNKIAPDIASAMDRARNIAGPLNARRLKRKTPCAMGDEIKCYDCSSPERICRGFVILDRPMMGMGCEIVLINEELGY